MKIQVIAHPNSKRPHVENRDGVFHVYVSPPPEDGKANWAVIGALAEHFDVPRFEVELKSGASAKIKLFEIHEVD